jgi:glycosyltransferase involved in cell wall biosynthesis
VSEPLFSIVIACYNQEAFVKASVESALTQRYPSKEVIVVDDCSKDRTAEVLRSFGNSITFAPLPSNSGACAARNHGVALAKGKYIVFLDGDDALMPWALDAYSRLVCDRHPKIILGRCALCSMQIPSLEEFDSPREIQFVEYPDFFSKDRPWVYNTSSLIVERQAFCATDGWSPEIFFQDIQDLLNSMATAGNTVLVLAPSTVWYRMHTSNASSKVPLFIKGIYKLLEKLKSGRYPGGKNLWVKRSAWFGGLIFYWVKQSIRTGHYRDAILLFASRWWMIFLVSVRRGISWMVGRKSVEVLQIEVDCQRLNSSFEFNSNLVEKTQSS